MGHAKSDFYQQLRTRLSRWMEGRTSKHRYAEYLLLAPDLFHLLCKLSIDKRVPVEEKAKVAAALAYFISPIDLLPEAVLGPVGYLDDVALSAYVLNSIISRTSPEVVRSQWAGDGDVLDVVQGILAAADDMVGSGLWDTLRSVVGGGRKRSRGKARAPRSRGPSHKRR